ncbi:MAG TPA: TIGR03808 family TAT-translocated repetitive protein [Methylomirabilota bacterium]|nr:TIGR03808 family TAT-translocated repetitive protein [Methylomirabilota bacterium]
MDRRSFLLGTGAMLVGAAPAVAETTRIRLADLRGSIGTEAIDVRPGAVDDQSAVVQAAIDKASSEGKPLFLPPGRYEVSNLRLPSRLKLIGIPGETRLVYSGGGHLLYAEGGSGIAIDGVVLDGANRALGEDTPGLLHMIGAADVTLERSEIVGSARNAIALEGCSGRISACRISGARDAGMWTVGSRGVSIVDNVVSDCGDGGILVHRWEDGPDNTIVSRNRVERIEARSGGTGQVGNGINIFRANGVIVADNHVSDCAFSAIRSNAGSNVQITGNQCLSSGETAIYSEFGFEGAVIANNIVDGASIGISVANYDEGGRLAAVSGNIVRNLRKGAPYPDEFGLDFGIGISIEADTAVTGNVVEGAPSLGVLVGWGPFTRNVVATGNVIRSAGVGVGVTVVEGSGSVTIASNVIVDTPGGAVRGMRWADFVTGDLALGGAGAFPHLAVSANRVG